MVQNKLSRVAEIQVIYKPHYNTQNRPKITNASLAYKLFLAQWSMDKIEYLEEFKMMLLSRSNRVLGIVDISTDGISKTVADPKVIFGIALKAAASGIILCHNHPSGALEPGSDNIKVAEKLCWGAKILEIEIVDYLIISKNSFYSYSDEGLL
ncbi:JAB domain-containing protein [Pedobacter heparinus]|uniref:DNA repair protein RadC n=1 Tax=Pedobacter heparinus (strain ATCC 13125 / DSM 2366 / CIP 104194 / JCM 7457 / NBRC 12017 / NCIMB 9290 / NRRL B-14731 / HIM 762-3) TaxID=485917 RepID=C6XXT7_PEDHD|nr:JAB domain-containing protein [Pedobacter heparinus]ACU04355.1 DNA repair protein RadC [Pedobacter heparinus DSM 2366]